MQLIREDTFIINSVTYTLRVFVDYEKYSGFLFGTDGKQISFPKFSVTWENAVDFPAIGGSIITHWLAIAKDLITERNKIIKGE